MKKLILSAVFALACFTAQAKNEVIKNDDEKKPKAKKVIVKSAKENNVSPGYCTVYGYISGSCDGVATASGTFASASTCNRASFLLMLKLMTMDLCG